MSHLSILGAELPEQTKEYSVKVFSIISKTKEKNGKSEWVEQFYIANPGDGKFMISAIDIAVVAGQDSQSNELKHCGFGVGGTTPNDGKKSAITFEPSIVKLVPTLLRWDKVPLLKSPKNIAKVISNSGKEIDVTVERFLSE